MVATTGHFLRILGALGCALLTACAVAPPETPSTPAPAAEAERLQAAGQLRSAASLWEEAAALAGQPLEGRYRLRAAEAWLATGEATAAERQLSQVDERQLPATERDRHALLGAELALLRGDADAAAFYLELARDGLGAEQRARYRQLEDSVLRLRADPASNLLDRIASALGSMNPSDPDEGSVLLRDLERASSGLLEQAVNSAPGKSTAGSWADLALRIRRGLVSGDGLDQAAGQWAADYPDHAVSRQGFVALARAYGSQFQAPERIAVLLPMQGGLAAAGLAIRDGMLGAYLSNPGVSSLAFYESGDTPEAALQAYQRAVADGAHWIVGPVNRDSVAALSTAPDRSLPALMLNDPEPQAGEWSGEPLYSLSLSQEEEARTIALRMLGSGIRRVITLATASAWGQRMEQAFVEAFERQGGAVTEQGRVPAGESDHSDLLTRLLHIDESEDRRDRLQSLLGQTLAFEPHHRDDFDAFFLAAGPEQARQLRPQLRFFEVGDQPVFAMSRVFSGTPDRIADQDLNGIILPLTRIQLAAASRDNVLATESVRRGTLASLYAVGMDAWNVLRWLPLLSADRELDFPGAVGDLRVSARGKLQREPAWAVFADGQPVHMAWPAALP